MTNSIMVQAALILLSIRCVALLYAR